MSTTRWATSTRLTSSTSRTAAPASKRLISSRSASSPRTGRARSAAARRRARSPGRSRARASCSTSPAIRTVVSGVRSSWETSETNRRCTRRELLELADLALQVGGHLVERRGQAGEVVLAPDPQPLLELPAASRSATRRASRIGVTTWRVTSQVSRRPGRAAGPAVSSARVTSASVSSSCPSGTGSRACSGRGRRAAGPWPTTMPGDVDRRAVARRLDPGVGPGGAARSREVGGAASGHAVGVEARARNGAVGDRRAPVVTGPASTTPKPRTVPRSMIGSKSRRAAARGVVVGARHGGQAGLGLARSRSRPRRPTAVAPGVDQAVAGLLEQEPADAADDDRGREQQGADHDAGLDRPAPEGEAAARRTEAASGRLAAARLGRPAL
jgi:hypothetical protein